MPEMVDIRSALIKGRNMIINHEATAVTIDDTVHEVSLEGKRIGHIIKIENKETPSTVTDIDGSSGSTKTLDESVKKIYLVRIGKDLPVKRKTKFLVVLVAMKLKDGT